MTELRIESISYLAPEAVALVAALNAEVEQRYAGDPDDLDKYRRSSDAQRPWR